MPLTTQERQSFTAEKLAQLDRMDGARLDEYLDPTPPPGETRTPEETASIRAKVIGQWANSTADQLRARVNCLRINGGTPEWAPENDYSASKQALIEAETKNHQTNINRFPTIIAERALKSGHIIQADRDELIAIRDAVVEPNLKSLCNWMIKVLDIE